MKTILVTGGAGFVGSSLSLRLKADFPKCSVIAFDNLKRKGSHLNLERLKSGGVEFIHGDIRNRPDLASLPKFDLLLECSAEPSVQAGLDGNPDYLVQTNLFGTWHCLEAARKNHADIIFLSTSRVYSINTIKNLKYRRISSRFVLESNTGIKGVSKNGFSEELSTAPPVSLYGATKLASEILLLEYIHQYGLKGVINRCSILTGPWQMGKTDQGVAVLWMAAHIYKKPLSYFGYGGKGIQVRDFLHINDLYRLLLIQIAKMEKFSGRVYNVGGGIKNTLSLCEMTELCRDISEKKINTSPRPEESKADIPCFVTDNSKIMKSSGWKPEISVHSIFEEICSWIKDNRDILKPVIG